MYRGLYRGKEVAIKVFTADTFTDAADAKEIMLLRMCQSDHVVQFKGVAHVGGGAKWIVMEYMDGGWVP